LTKKPSRRKKNSHPYKNLPLDIAIGITGILLIGFIYSLSQNTVHTGVPIKVTFPEIDTPKMLAKELYSVDPIKNIRVEILNGCGIKGIAAKTSDFLRSKHRIDVVRSENADKFDYSKTIIIGRNEELDKILSVSKAFDISINNTNHIRHVPDETLGVDVTIILGKDINSFPHISEYVSQSK
tara:strand:+ start:230 stop:775 length:546 start_codon:yes stop_codon:yes gene_type:complete